MARAEPTRRRKTSQTTGRSAWSVEDAKARLSEVLQKASVSGPQHITKRGRPAAVVVSAAQFVRLQRKTTRTGAWLDHYAARCAGEMPLPRFDDRGRDFEW